MTEATYFRGRSVPSVRVFGQNVDVCLTPVSGEVQRRRRFGAGPPLTHDLIRALISLPVDAPVSIASLGPDVVVVLDDALEIGAAEIVDEDIMRRAVPPVTLVGFVKMIRVWEDAQSLTLLRTHAPRLAVARPALAARIMREIDNEVGVAVAGVDDQRVMRHPGTRWVRPSWQRWAVAEAAFEAWQSSLVTQER